MGHELKIELASPQSCTGCAACAAICPSDAIRMQQDPLGFAIPQIDAVKCSKCGQCRQACPALQGVSLHPKPACYAAQADDRLRIASSSGGIFSLLAREIFLRGGVVCGAVFDEQFLVRHAFAEDEAGLAAMRGSKYLQSDVGDTYAQAQAFLRQGRYVLYSGCPCQIAGLYRFLQEDYERLYTVDLLCLGVPSPQFFTEYLACAFPEETVESISFRDKAHGQGWRSDSLFIRTDNGGEHACDISASSYEACFHQNIFLRECCYSCPYNTQERVGDLSLGDFWGIEAYDPAWNDNRGTSLVLVNSEKGQMLFKGIAPGCKRIEEVPPEVSSSNRLNGKPLKRPAERDRFLDLYSRLGYRKAAEYAGMKKYDVGIIGCWSVENHGSNLSYYALYQTIKDMGLEPLMIERTADAPWPPNAAASGFAVSPYAPWELSPIFSDRREMRGVNRQCETFLLGSDQLFYHDLYRSLGNFADLGYVDKSKRKVAYAASVGRPAFEGDGTQRAQLAYFLRRFDAFSVREEDAVPLFAETFGVKAEWVLDPVFLCKTEHYRAMAARGQQASKEKYMAVYLLDPTARKTEVLQGISAKLGMPYQLFSDVARAKGEMAKDPAGQENAIATNEDWLRAILDSDFVVTDSFHGTCFAILFQKPFICIGNSYRGISRFTSLLRLLHLEERMVDDLSGASALSICMKRLDYAPVMQILQQEIAKSKAWLIQALQCPHDPATSGYDLLDERVGILEPLQLENRKRGLATESWLSNSHQRINRLEELYPRIDMLEQLYSRVDTLEQLYRRVDTLEQLYQRVDTLEQIYPRVDALEQLYQRVDALEQLYQRVDALEEDCRKIEELQTSLTQSDGEIRSLQTALGRLQAETDSILKAPWNRLYRKFKKR